MSLTISSILFYLTIPDRSRIVKELSHPPLLDRIDIHIEVPPVRYQELSDNSLAETSARIKERVNKAREIQKERFKDKGIMCNAQMGHKQVRKFCVLGKEENELLKMAMSELNLSARAYDKILKVSRTIGDLAGSKQIKAEHITVVSVTPNFLANSLIVKPKSMRFFLILSPKFLGFLGYLGLNSNGLILILSVYINSPSGVMLNPITPFQNCVL